MDHLDQYRFESVATAAGLEKFMCNHGLTVRFVRPFVVARTGSLRLWKNTQEDGHQAKPRVHFSAFLDPFFQSGARFLIFRFSVVIEYVPVHVH